MDQGYAKGLLSTGEVVLIDTRQHWMAAVRFVIRPIILLGIAVLLWLFNQWFDFDGVLNLLNELARWALIILVVVAAIWLPIDLVRWWSRHYILTNRRAMRMEGVLRKKSIDSSLEHINDIRSEQSFLGRQLGYADLTLYTASDTANEQYAQLLDGLQFKRAVLDAKEAIRAGSPMQELPEGFIVKGGTNEASMRADGKIEQAAEQIAPPQVPPSVGDGPQEARPITREDQPNAYAAGTLDESPGAAYDQAPASPPMESSPTVDAGGPDAWGSPEAASERERAAWASQPEAETTWGAPEQGQPAEASAWTAPTAQPEAEAAPWGGSSREAEADHEAMAQAERDALAEAQMEAMSEGEAEALPPTAEAAAEDTGSDEPVETPHVEASTWGVTDTAGEPPARSEAETAILPEPEPEPFAAPEPVGQAVEEAVTEPDREAEAASEETDAGAALDAEVTPEPMASPAPSPEVIGSEAGTSEERAADEGGADTTDEETDVAISDEDTGAEPGVDDEESRPGI